MVVVRSIHTWYSDPTMDESLYETTYSALACWAEPGARIPDETTILNFRRLLEKHELATGILGATNG